MKNSVLALLLVVLLFSGFTGAVGFGTVQASTDVSGIISSDTTWTEANSPYLLTGPVSVKSGVTLTIKAGVTVNLNGYYIHVNGTLYAVGTAANQIRIYGNIGGNGGLIFMESSINWNEQTGSGSIIENAFISEMEIHNSSQKINKNSIGKITIYGGSPTISQNSIGTSTEISLTEIYGGSPVILNNFFNRSQIDIYGGSPVISHNNIMGILKGQIHDNEMYSPYYGINLQGYDSDVQISDNTISMHEKAGINVIEGKATIERNLIINSGEGIHVEKQVTIRHNTIADNFAGIRGPIPSQSTIIYNNILNNTWKSICLEGTSNDVNATYNWWGTTDAQAINQTIHDSKNDFTLGTVIFVPFLTEPNPDAPEIATSTPTPTPTPTPSPTPSPKPEPESSPSPSPQDPESSQELEQPEPFPTAIVAISAITITAVVGIGLLLYFKKPHKKSSFMKSMQYSSWRAVP